MESGRVVGKPEVGQKQDSRKHPQASSKRTRRRVSVHFSRLKNRIQNSRN